MRLAFCLGFLSVSAATALAGCDANQLYIGSRTVVGVNAAVNPEMTNGSLIVGYDRTFAAVIPRSAVEDQRDPRDQTVQTGQTIQKQDAMTALGCSTLLVKGITIRRFTESIATGKAAQTFAEALKHSDPKPVKDFFDCFKDKPENKPAPAAEAAKS